MPTTFATNHPPADRGKKRFQKTEQQSRFMWQPCAMSAVRVDARMARREWFARTEVGRVLCHEVSRNYRVVRRVFDDSWIAQTLSVVIVISRS